MTAPSDAEVRVTRAALDLLSRVLCGQVEAVEETLRDYCILLGPHGPVGSAQIRRFGESLRVAKRELGLSRHGSLSILSSDVHPAARLAFRLMRSLDGREDPTLDDMAEEADAKWTQKYGEPWYGRPANKEEVEHAEETNLSDL